MRNVLIIGGICVLALIIGIVLYMQPTRQKVTDQIIAPVHQEAAVSFVQLDHGTHSDESTRKNYVIYDQKAFDSFWKKIHTDDKGKIPSVDFAKNYVIAVYAGEKPTGGYDISVSKVTDANGVRAISVTLKAPGKNCVVTQSITSPYEFVVVPLSDAKLAHQDQTETVNCQ